MSDTCDFITTSSECEAAAEYLGLSDISAYASYNQGSLDPPYCYFEGGNLQFNSDETNTGECGGGSGEFHDKCLCKSSGQQRNVPESDECGGRKSLNYKLTHLCLINDNFIVLVFWSAHHGRPVHSVPLLRTTDLVLFEGQCITEGGDDPGKLCVFPWKYSKYPTTEYKGCANPDDDPRGSWCGTELTDGEYIYGSGKWGFCNIDTCGLGGWHTILWKKLSSNPLYFDFQGRMRVKIAGPTVVRRADLAIGVVQKERAVRKG